MKEALIFLAGIFFLAPSFSQKRTVDKEPRDMVFCPAGSFTATREMNGELRDISVSVDAFWISNEISNQEFREFYDDILGHPDDTLSYLDIKEFAKSRNAGDSDKKIKDFLIRKPYSEIAGELFDKNKWNPYEADPTGSKYFFNKKYNDYPVVGVTYEGAKYYCTWRTNKENAALKAKGKAPGFDYRLPVEMEWAYALDYAKEEKGPDEILAVTRGKANELGMYHMSDNVSEWVINKAQSRNGDIMQIVMGDSWKKSSQNQRQLVEPGTASETIGFRMVKSYGGK